jgi:hypothetical protein
MKHNLITVIPVYNGEEFILQTLQSVATQTLKPDRVVVLDNCSTDRTAQLVQDFRKIKVEYLRNPSNLGLFGNCNRALDFGAETEFLQILHADDLIAPQFYEVMTAALADCDGPGMAWCLDERIDENNQQLSVSGKADGAVEILPLDKFLRLKAEIGNQAFCATLLKPNGQPVPCRFRLDMPILGDMVYWAEFGTHCRKLAHVRRALAQYRWHGTNTTSFSAPNLDSLIADEWRAMQINEALRKQSPGWLRQFKLKGLLAVRSGIKAKRFKQQGNAASSREIVRIARNITGPFIWRLGQVLVEIRDLLVYGLMRRPRHPKNVYT